ncbi:hypothetical protein CULT_1670010 [[Clostridium] ultunense Esp]|nr:hypothetical protein CULT_1670010 [[Clostridium] ultunense Esp]
MNEKETEIPPPFLFMYGADDETRTRDPNLGKVVFYQLNYVRKDGGPSGTRTLDPLIKSPTMGILH